MKAVQAHFADLLFGREFRIGSRLVVVLPESGLIGFVAEPAVAGLFVREPTVAGGLVAEFTFAVGFVAELAIAGLFVCEPTVAGGLVAGFTFAVGFVAELAVAEFLGSPVVAVGGFFAAGLIAERAARFVAVAVTFVRTGAVALPFVAETAARFVECRTVVLRKVGIVRRPLDGLAVIGRLLRIGSITLQTRATLDTLRRSGHGTLTLVASETRKHRGRVVFKVFHNQFECLRGKVNRIFRIKAYCVPDSEIKAAGRYKLRRFCVIFASINNARRRLPGISPRRLSMNMNREILRHCAPQYRLEHHRAAHGHRLSTAIAGRSGRSAIRHATIGALAIGVSIFNFIYWNCSFVRMGTSGLTAQAFGARQLPRMHQHAGRGRCSWPEEWALLMLLLQYPLGQAGAVGTSTATNMIARVLLRPHLGRAGGDSCCSASTAGLSGMQNAPHPDVDRPSRSKRGPCAVQPLVLRLRTAGWGSPASATARSSRSGSRRGAGRRAALRHATAGVHDRASTGRRWSNLRPLRRLLRRQPRHHACARSASWPSTPSSQGRRPAWTNRTLLAVNTHAAAVVYALLVHERRIRIRRRSADGPIHRRTRRRRSLRRLPAPLRSAWGAGRRRCCSSASTSAGGATWWGVFAACTAPESPADDRRNGRRVHRAGSSPIPVASSPCPSSWTASWSARPATRVMRDSMILGRRSVYFAIFFACYAADRQQRAVAAPSLLYMLLRGVLQYFMTHRLRSIYVKATV